MKWKIIFRPQAIELRALTRICNADGNHGDQDGNKNTKECYEA
jgi:hypothetical protein